MSTIEREKLKSNAEVIKWYMPVIETLISLGGSAHRQNAVNAVIESSNASQEERTIKDGSSALARTIEFARNDLRVEGIIDGSNRGTWKLTDLGWRIIISNELAGMIRSKSVKISAILRKNKKENRSKTALFRTIFLTEAESGVILKAEKGGDGDAHHSGGGTV